MGVMRDVDIIWEELLDAFENRDQELVYLLDRLSGEIYLVPADYDDEGFWQEVAENSDQYLSIPGFDYEQERLLLHQFIQEIDNPHLRDMLTRAYAGKLPYGKVEEILSFYPDEMDHLEALRESHLSERIKRWLEEHDIFESDIL
ncbi:MAG: hypothetical protein HZC44_14240 [Geobacter sp.]|nr:hypothetical protein [Geobacter sp.]